MMKKQTPRECTGCGKYGADKIYSDSSKVVHYWHDICLKEFVRWLKKPLEK